MSLIFMDGFQDFGIMPKPEWAAGLPTSATGRDGSTNGGMAAGNTTTSILSVAPTTATCIYGIAQNLTGAQALTGTNLYNLIRDTAGTAQIDWHVNSSGLIEIRRTSRAGTLLATSSGHTPIALNTWHRYEIKVVLHTSTGSVIINLDGVQVASFSGATSSTISNVGSLVFGVSSSLAGMIYDDLYVCDTAGSVANDFLGDVVVKSLYPTAAGDSTQFTPSTGSNWAAVDETPPSMTDYVSDLTSGHRDLYNVTDTTGVIATIYGVRASYYGTKSDSGAALIKPAVKENSVVTVEAGQGLSISGGAIHGQLRTVRPSDSAAWTQADIDALQVGQEVA